MTETNPQIDLAFNYLENTGINLFLTGKAGTGKTTFLKRLKETSPKRMVVVAPTGVAAINAGGVTIHSFFQLPFGPYLPDAGVPGSDARSFANRFSREKINIIRSMDLLVIDEISMVRADLLDAISDTLRRFRDRAKPFGGVQLLLIGDLQQLAPVAKEEEWSLLKEHYSSPYFFDSRAMRESEYHCIELTHVYRQADSEFVRLLNNIRENRFDDETLRLLNQRYRETSQLESIGEGYITLTTHNSQAQQINERRLSRLPGRSYSFRAEVKEDFPAYAYPTDETLTLKEGAQVMFVKNDSSGERRYYNGKIGRVVFVSPNKIIVVDERGEEITVDKETWNNVKYTIDEESKAIKETIAGSFSQYPLKTAWAITIHKSQGLTFERAIIDASAAFSHGQVYVALSRCKSLDGLILSSPITREAMISDRQLQDYTATLTERQPDEEQLNAARRAYYLQLITELFDFQSLQRKLHYTAYTADSQLRKLYPELARRYAHLQDSFRAEVTEVGERFQQQLTRMLASCPTCEPDEQTQERIRKGCAYFLEQIGKECQPLIAASNVEIDNKEAKKQFGTALKALADELTIKIATLQASRSGFRLGDYLSAKAKASIEEAPARKRSSHRSAEEKLSVGSDIQHPRLYEQLKQWRYNLSVEKGLPPYTILQQKALIGVCNTRPTSAKELLRIPGIGKKVVENHGQALLDIVAAYSPLT